MLDVVVGKAIGHAYKNVNAFSIKQRVDVLGVEDFIAEAASMAGASGFVAGVGGGPIAMAAAPMDVVNVVWQHARVVLGVSYAKTGRFMLPFEDFLRITAVSMGVGAGAGAAAYGTGILAEAVAKAIAKRVAAGTAAKVVPVLGGLVGGGINFVFIYSVGNALLALSDGVFHAALTES